ncbi:MAG: Crp/Fnr family transcriptional regulator [Candidatus Acidiferrales bacterium]
MKVSVAATGRPEAGFRFFEGLLPAQIDEIVRAGKQRRFFAKQVVTYPGEPATHAYLLCSGRARHFAVSAEGEKVVFQWLIRPGDHFAYSALLTQQRSVLAGVEVVESGSAIVWERERIRALCAKYPRLWENVLEAVFDDFVRLIAHDMSLIGRSASHRLRQALIDLGYGLGRVVAGGMHIEVTNEDLASMAGVTMFTASRCLSDWARRGLIKKRRGSILLRSPERLLSAEI